MEVHQVLVNEVIDRQVGEQVGLSCVMDEQAVLEIGIDYFSSMNLSWHQSSCLNCNLVVGLGLMLPIDQVYCIHFQMEEHLFTQEEDWVSD